MAVSYKRRLAKDMKALVRKDSDIVLIVEDACSEENDSVGLLRYFEYYNEEPVSLENSFLIDYFTQKRNWINHGFYFEILPNQNSKESKFQQTAEFIIHSYNHINLYLVFY